LLIFLGSGLGIANTLAEQSSEPSAFKALLPGGKTEEGFAEMARKAMRGPRPEIPLLKRFQRASPDQASVLFVPQMKPASRSDAMTRPATETDAGVLSEYVEKVEGSATQSGRMISSLRSDEGGGAAVEDV